MQEKRKNPPAGRPCSPHSQPQRAQPTGDRVGLLSLDIQWQFAKARLKKGPMK